MYCYYYCINIRHLITAIIVVNFIINIKSYYNCINYCYYYYIRARLALYFN